jgi:ferredoxin
MLISNGNSKLGKIPNVSLIPIKDCGNCGLCKKLCYANRFYRMYPTVKKAWDENSRLAHNDLSKYIYTIWKYIENNQPSYFRYHVGGDILDQTYLHYMKLTAALFPKTKFLCFTKMFDLDYSNLPNNLKIFFSIHPSMEVPLSRLKIKTAWVQDGTETRIPKTAFVCPGKCQGCMSCWNSHKQNVVFHKH